MKHSILAPILKLFVSSLFICSTALFAHTYHAKNQKFFITHFGDSFSTDFSVSEYNLITGVKVFNQRFLPFHFPGIDQELRNARSENFLEAFRVKLSSLQPNSKFIAKARSYLGLRMTVEKDGADPAKQENENGIKQPIKQPIKQWLTEYFLPEIRLEHELYKYLASRNTDLDPYSIITLWVGHNDLDWIHKQPYVRGKDQEYTYKAQERLQLYLESWERIFYLFESFNFKGNILVFAQANHTQRTLGYLEAEKIHQINPRKFQGIDVSKKLFPEGSDASLRKYTLELATKMDDGLKETLLNFKKKNKPDFKLFYSDNLKNLDYSSVNILQSDGVHFTPTFLEYLGSEAGNAVQKLLMESNQHVGMP